MRNVQPIEGPEVVKPVAKEDEPPPKAKVKKAPEPPPPPPIEELPQLPETD